MKKTGLTSKEKDNLIVSDALVSIFLIRDELFAISKIVSPDKLEGLRNKLSSLETKIYKLNKKEFGIEVLNLSCEIQNLKQDYFKSMSDRG